MERSYAFLAAITLCIGTLQAQTSDVVVFSDMGEKFTLVIDGDVKNETPAARVVATGIKNSTPLIVVRLADATVPPVKQNAWMEAGQEYTLRLTVNKKGEHVLRMQGQEPIGTTSSAPADKPAPTSFVDDPQPSGAVSEPPTPAVTDGGTTHTTTVVETTETSGGDPENVNINFGINGMGVNMAVNDGTGTATNKTTTTTTTTTTHTTSSSGTLQTSFAPPAEKPQHTGTPEPGYRMPGYSGPIGCSSMPMSESEFGEVKQSISSKGFEETKLSVAKQIGRDHCFTAAQVKGIMQLFGFEDSKLDFAKFAYDHTYDIGNYYKVNDVFSFESSVDELDQYIRSR